jgi:hypothetical protein
MTINKHLTISSYPHAFTCIISTTNQQEARPANMMRLLLILSALVASCHAGRLEYNQLGSKLVGNGSFIYNTPYPSRQGKNIKFIYNIFAQWHTHWFHCCELDDISGSSVSLSSDGRILAVGGPEDDGRKGATWIFVVDGPTYQQLGVKLVGSGSIGSSYQGKVFAITNFVVQFFYRPIIEKRQQTMFQGRR